MTITVDLACAGCGSALEVTKIETTEYNGPQALVKPCLACMDSAKDDGYSDGYARGEDDGFEQAREAFK